METRGASSSDGRTFSAAELQAGFRSTTTSTGPRARLHVKTERGARAFHKIWNTVA